MKKLTPKINSIFKLSENFSFSKYSKQTIKGLFRSLTETLLEIDDNSLILYKVNDTTDFQGLIKRLEFSNIDVFSFDKVDVKENFLIAISDRFAFSLVWDETQEFSDTVVSINHAQVSTIIEYLQNTNFNKDIEETYSKMRYDRRENKIFSNILTKLLGSFEELQKDFICQDTISAEHIHQKFDLMVSKISHEGRNYLGLIDLHSSLMNKKLSMDMLEKESLIKSSKVISKSIDNIDNLFNNLKFYEKGINLQKQENNFKNLLTEIKELFSIKLKEAHIQLNIESKEVIFNFDYSALKQVLVNLLKNSIEAIGSNGEIEIKTIMSDDIEIYIKDNASGIEEEIKNSIFELNISSKQRGSGVGLNLSKELIEKHNGSIEVYETSKKGTTFLIKLPA